jgi:hypothetical protein
MLLAFSNSKLTKVFLSSSSRLIQSLKLPWEEFLDKYIDLVATGSCYVTRNDMEETEGLKEFLGFKVG